MISVTYNGAAITGIVTSARVQKTFSAAGSEAEITAICSPGDKFLPSVNPSCGDGLRVSWNGNEVFSGDAERVSFSADGLSLSLLCLDGASLLAKNEVYGPFNGSPASIAEKVCNLAGLEFGSAWDMPGKVTIPASTARSAHSVIRMAYGERCVTEWAGGAVNILQPGKRKCTAELGKLLSASARHSVENMVNSVHVVGYLGRVDAMAENAGDIETYGQRRRIYTLSGAKSTALTQAENALLNTRREAAVKAFGFHAVRCGDSISVDAAQFGISGEWTVSSVTYDFSGGFCVTSLGLTKED